VIYADNAATTKISDTALEKMLPFLSEQYGNASAQYSLGIKAKRAIEHARKQVAIAIGAESSEITFTSGGSEANSWVLRSVIETYCGESIHIITSSIEHPSVMNTCQVLEKRGVEVTFLPVDNTGHISINDLNSAIKPNTKLVSIMFANNEIGSIQPIYEIGQLLKDKGITFHTDAVQAIGHIPIDVDDMHIDILTASAHKFNGPKGTGILYKRLGIELHPLVFGGEQEHGLRAGTENVAGIVATGFAIEESTSIMNKIADKLSILANLTIDGIRKNIPSVRVNNNVKNNLPGLINLNFEGISGESLVHILDMKGICISTSSACKSLNGNPSHVLLAIGLSEEQAKSSIRISYGRYNTEDEAKMIVSTVCDAYFKIKIA